MTRSCIFCGGAPVRNEHVWPDWVMNFLRAELPGVPLVGTRSLVSAAGGSTTWEAPGLDVSVKQVCAACNEGWMSNLEEAAARVMKPLIRGEPRILTPDDQVLLARWAAKTALVFEFAYASSAANYIPASDRQWLRGNETPPASTTVWLAGHTGRRIAFHRSVPFEGSPADSVVGGSIGTSGTISRPEAHSTTLAILHLVIKVFGDSLPEERSLELPAVTRDVVIKIWPRQLAAVLWPPPRALDDDALFDFASITVFA